MALITIRAKCTAVITSSRPIGFLEARLANVLWPALRQAMIDEINADAQTSHDSHVVDPTVHYYAGDDQAEINVAGSLTVETTRTVDQIRAGFDAVLDLWKVIIRDEIAGDAQTTLDGVDYPQPFHVHRAATSADEDVP